MYKSDTLSAEKMLMAIIPFLWRHSIVQKRFCRETAEREIPSNETPEKLDYQGIGQGREDPKANSEAQHLCLYSCGCELMHICDRTVVLSVWAPQVRWVVQGWSTGWFELHIPGLCPEALCHSFPTLNTRIVSCGLTLPPPTSVPWDWALGAGHFPFPSLHPRIGSQGPGTPSLTPPPHTRIGPYSVVLSLYAKIGPWGLLPLLLSPMCRAGASHGPGK